MGGRPQLTFPDAEADLVREHYASGRVILEYGSGGSTLLAAGQPGKFVISVESDRQWAINLQRDIDRADLPSPAIVYHVDIGETGSWGRPVNDRSWQRFHRYPVAVWDEPFFRHPDVVLIDGRFRPACFATLCMRIARPTTVLFDDYVNRPLYHSVERFAAPTQTIGRMAVFELAPGMISRDETSLLVSLFFEATFAGDNVSYERSG